MGMFGEGHIGTRPTRQQRARKEHDQRASDPGQEDAA
jgi:hypothetical protein